MTEHVHEDLPALLRGEADRATVMQAAAHLRECADCRQELISAVVAHSSLSSAARMLPQELIQPLTSESGTREAGTGASVTELPLTESPDDPPPLPDLSAVFAQVRAETAAQADARTETDTTQTPAHAAARPRAKRGPWLAVAAAVVGLGVGAGGVALSNSVDSSSPSTQNVALAAFDKGTEPASVSIVGGDQMRLDATSLPAPAAGKLYEVWLTNAARSQMYAVGSLGSSRKGSYTVPAGLMDTYSAIEVSVQPVSNSAYSGISVLRGSYA
jgi:hypothetical protein